MHNFATIGVARGVEGADAPPAGRQKFFIGIFRWNEAKMGLNLVSVPPQRDKKGSWWLYMTYMTM